MKYNKGFAPILIALIIAGALIIGGGAYYLGKSSKIENKEVADNSSNNPIIDNGKEDTTIVNNQAKLTTYDSKTFGYSIGYSGIDTNKVIVNGDGKSINLFPNQSNIDTLEVVDSPYIIPSYLSSVGTVKIGENQYKKFKDNNTSRNYYYLISGLQNNKSIWISVENDSDTPNYLDLSSLKINTVNSETFKNEPGEIKSITADGINKWVIDVDMLSLNPKWTPGSATEKFFLNQNTKIRNLNVTLSTKTYECGAGKDGNVTTPDVIVNTSDFIKKIQSGEYKTRYFDITGSNITAIYEQCLP